MKQSSFFSLNWADLGKAAIVAAITAGLSSIVTSLDTGALPTIEELKTAGIMALTAGISYLVKNLLTNSNGEIAKKES